jgi:hypothetical protein
MIGGVEERVFRPTACHPIVIKMLCKEYGHMTLANFIAIETMKYGI